MLFNYSQMQIFDSPYPYVIIKDFLDEDDLKSLLDEFPKSTSSFQNVMGGRARLASDEAEFYNFIAGNKTWRKFYSTLNSKEFTEKVVDIFSDKIADYNAIYDFKTFSFDDDFLEKQAYTNFLRNIEKRQLHEVSSKELLKTVVLRFLKKIKNKTAANNSFSNKELYLHIDISEASTGYGREIHHDSDNRLAAMVFYLTDQGKMQGGEFGVHEYIDDVPLERCVPQPDESEMRLSNLITPQKNTLVLFLSTPNSYHSVPIIRSLETSRKFVYAGITCKNPNVWANVVRYKQ